MEGFLVLPLKGDLDDQEKMQDIANKLEEQADKEREKVDKLASDKVSAQGVEAKRLADEEKLRLLTLEEEKAKKIDKLKKEMDLTGHHVSFHESKLAYRKLAGPRFDKFAVTATDIYIITEEDKLLSIIKHSTHDP